MPLSKSLGWAFPWDSSLFPAVVSLTFTLSLSDPEHVILSPKLFLLSPACHCSDQEPCSHSWVLSLTPHIKMPANAISSTFRDTPHSEPRPCSVLPSLTWAISTASSWYPLRSPCHFHSGTYMTPFKSKTWCLYNCVHFSKLPSSVQNCT